MRKNREIPLKLVLPDPPRQKELTKQAYEWYLQGVKAYEKATGASRQNKTPE